MKMCHKVKRKAVKGVVRFSPKQSLKIIRYTAAKKYKCSEIYSFAMQLDAVNNKRSSKSGPFKRRIYALDTRIRLKRLNVPSVTSLMPK